MKRGISVVGMCIVMAIVGCAGGTMGTGVRKYANNNQEEMKIEEKGWFDFQSHAARCVLEKGEHTVRMKLTPILGSLRADEVDGSTCRATILPQRHTLSLLVSREHPTRRTQFQLQRQKEPGHWVLLVQEEANASAADPEVSRFDFLANRLIPGAKYRVVVSEAGATPEVFEFSIGNVARE